MAQVLSKTQEIAIRKKKVKVWIFFKDKVMSLFHMTYTLCKVTWRSAKKVSKSFFAFVLWFLWQCVQIHNADQSESTSRAEMFVLSWLNVYRYANAQTFDLLGIFWMLGDSCTEQQPLNFSTTICWILNPESKMIWEIMRSVLFQNWKFRNEILILVSKNLHC